MSVSNFSSLAGLEVAEKFVVVGGGWWWVVGGTRDYYVILQRICGVALGLDN